MTINNLPALREHLQWAIEIEHGTLPPYLLPTHPAFLPHSNTT